MPTGQSFDLQSHSTHSDGELSPTGGVMAAAAAGVRLLALTDHDTLDGVAEARRAGIAHGVTVLPAVEISVHDPCCADLHMCAYLVDAADSALNEQLRRSRADREARSELMADALTELGWEIAREPLEARRAAGAAVGRPHLAQAVLAHPGNRARLQAEGLTDPSAFLVAYLIEGRPAFRERAAPSVSEAIELIHGAGGLAVWAHPFWDLATDAEVLDALERFAAGGLDGVEAFYITHTRAQTELLARHGGELGLLTTGSSDFHGPNHRLFNRFGAFSTYGLTPDLGALAESQGP